MIPDWVLIVRSLKWILWLYFYLSLQYIVLLILVFLFELSAGTLAYIYERNVPDELNMTLSETFSQNYALSERHTKAIDLMQQNLQCCGAIRFEDYRNSMWRKSRRELITPVEGRLVPDSCCITFTPKCGVSDHPSNIPYTVNYKNFINNFNYLTLFCPTGLYLPVFWWNPWTTHHSRFDWTRNLHHQNIWHCSGMFLIY